MTQRLYNKYRPVLFDEVVGETDVHILKGVISSESYAYKREYLFFSDKGGVGKTTTALIFAKAINCHNRKDGNPCNKCQNCLMFDAGTYPDFVSLSGVDYNQVDKVKPIIDLARQYPRVDGEFKVILIDEFQRMSPQAMSEFLNIFEFGDNKTIFILTTTNKKSVIQPILTRLMPIEFRSPTVTQIHNQLQVICEAENVEYTSHNLNLIALLSENSFRDSLTLLEKYIIGYGGVGKSVVITSKYDSFIELLSNCVQHGVHTVEQDFQLLSKNVILDFPTVIFQLLNYDDLDICLISSRSRERVKWVLTTDMLINMSKMYFKYKPVSVGDFMLFMTLFEVDHLGVVGVDPSVKKLDVTKIMKQSGFSLGKVIHSKGSA
jgi:DNA polymerase III subunit gamma/tau